MSHYTIGSLAKAAGVGVETIRYYQRRGLLPTPARPGATRHYGENELKRLRFIRHAQHLGFSLEEAGGLLALDEIKDRDAARALARGKLDEIETRIRRLEAVRKVLQDLVGCCEHGPGADPCPILHALGSVADPLKTWTATPIKRGIKRRPTTDRRGWAP